MPLLEGAELYKIISEKPQVRPFSWAGPEACGFSLHKIFLYKFLKKIEMKHPRKPGFDLWIKIDQLCNSKVSKVTLAHLYSQGHEVLDFTESDYIPFYLVTVQQVKGSIFIPLNNLLHSQECTEVIAKDCISFKQWIQGINAMLFNKKKLNKLRTRIKIYT